MSFLGKPKISHTDLTKMDGNQLSIIHFLGENVICKFNDYTRRSKLYSISNFKKIGTYSEQIIGCWKYENTSYCTLYKTGVEYIISMYVNKARTEIDDIEPNIPLDYKNKSRKELRKIYHSKADFYANIYWDCTHESSSDSNYDSEKSHSEAEESESEDEILSKMPEEKEINYNLIKEESQSENFESDEESDSLEQERYHKKQKTYNKDIINEKHIDSIVKECFNIYDRSHYQHYKSFGFEELIIAYRDKSNTLNIFFRKNNEFYSFKIYNSYIFNYTISKLYESEFLFFDNKCLMGRKMYLFNRSYKLRTLIFDKYSNQMHCFYKIIKSRKNEINKNRKEPHKGQSIELDNNKSKMQIFYVKSRTDNTIHMNYYKYTYPRSAFYDPINIKMVIYYNYILLMNNIDKINDPTIYVINKYSMKIEYKIENVIQINPSYHLKYEYHRIEDIGMITKNQIYLLYNVWYKFDPNEGKSIEPTPYHHFDDLTVLNKVIKLEIILTKIDLRISWKIVRLLLLAHRKKQPEDCYIKTLPIELIKCIIMLLDYNMFNN
jgi:hypothetical protein